MTSDDRSEPQFPYPCCGYIVFHEEPGSYEICKICFWQDDEWSLRWMTEPAGGPNHDLSLYQAQRNYLECGAASPEYRQFVRPLRATDRRDPEWRMIDLSRDNPEAAVATDEGPYGIATLYYWRDTYWLKEKRRKP